jgi:uncharacterized protein YecE (DUF72 family)
VELRVGTSGFGYAEWKGPFYPRDLPAGEMLAFYAARLPAVEINNTFYRLPKAELLAGWAEQVPAGFRFAVKASRRITHLKRLREAGEETSYLLRACEALGERLGALLFQLPPQLRADRERLAAFLACLPSGTRAAFEFRHPSWLDEPVLELLRARDFAWVTVDSEEAAPPEIRSTASWGYLRLRRPGYAREELASWAARVQAQGWREAFLFFKHEDAGAGPALAAEFMALAGRSAERKRAKRGREPARRRAAG